MGFSTNREYHAGHSCTGDATVTRSRSSDSSDSKSRMRKRPINWPQQSPRGRAGAHRLHNTSEAENCAALKSHLGGWPAGRANSEPAIDLTRRRLPTLVHYLHNSISRLIYTDWRIIQRQLEGRAEWCVLRRCNPSWFSSAAPPPPTNDGARERRSAHAFYTLFLLASNPTAALRRMCAESQQPAADSAVFYGDSLTAV